MIFDTINKVALKMMICQAVTRTTMHTNFFFLSIGKIGGHNKESSMKPVRKAETNNLSNGIGTTSNNTE